MTKRHADSPTPSERWSVGEVVDLPIALDEERFAPNRESELLAARAALTREFGDLKSTKSPDVLRAWLARWRDQRGDHTPGAQMEDSLRYAGRIAAVSGLLLGLVAASDRLFFTGPEPLNVFALLGVFVLLPLVVSGIVLFAFQLRQESLGGIIHHFFLWAARPIARWKRAGTAHLSGELRSDDSWRALAKSLGRNRRLVQLPILSISQKFAFAFGIGLFLMLQLRVSFWELAFGWQTTLAAPGDVWHRVVRVIAAPWSWFWPEGCPTLEQVNATRYTRLDGAGKIDAEASRAWWPFLAASILVWSVLLRGLVLLIFRRMQTRRLAQYDPETPDAHLFLRRLMPVWSTGSEPIHAHPPEAVIAESSKVLSKGAQDWVVLVADEPDASMPSIRDLQNLIGVHFSKEIPFQFDDSMSDATTVAIEELRKANSAVAVLLPVSRDPIGEVCDTLKALEKSANGKTLILVLRGDRDRLGLWKQKLASWQIDLPVEYVPTA